MMMPCCISLVGMSGMTKAASSAIAEYFEAEVNAIESTSIEASIPSFADLLLIPRLSRPRAALFTQGLHLWILISMRPL